LPCYDDDYLPVSGTSALNQA